jgi:hypothetical protein
MIKFQVKNTSYDMIHSPITFYCMYMYVLQGQFRV